MLNERSIQAVADARISDSFTVPLYDSYCFSQIPQTYYHALTGQGSPGLPDDVWGSLPRQYDKVVVILIDALGWKFLERWKETPFLQRFFGNRGMASKITAQFPSTTSAHIPTLHTGLNVGQTGIYEWYMYEQLVDDVIIPLMFSYAADKGRDTLLHAGFNPEQVFPFETMYQRLSAAGVKSVCIQPHTFTPSPFDKAVCAGAEMRRSFTFTDALVALRKAILHSPSKGYFYLYYDGLDTTSHHRAPFSDHFNAEIEGLLYLLETYLMQPLDGHSPNTCILLTADHGQVATNDRDVPILNQIAPEIEAVFRLNQSGKPLYPAGSGRDMFLHIEPRYVEDAEGLLRRKLPPGFDLYRTSELIDRGIFGSDTDRLRARIGDLLILANGNGQLVWDLPDKPGPRFKGHHGAMLPDEMETGFLVTTLD